MGKEITYYRWQDYKNLMKVARGNFHKGRVVLFHDDSALSYASRAALFQTSNVLMGAGYEVSLVCVDNEGRSGYKEKINHEGNPPSLSVYDDKGGCQLVVQAAAVIRTLKSLCEGKFAQHHVVADVEMISMSINYSTILRYEQGKGGDFIAGVGQVLESAKEETKVEFPADSTAAFMVASLAASLVKQFGLKILEGSTLLFKDLYERVSAQESFKEADFGKCDEKRKGQQSEGYVASLGKGNGGG